MNSGMNGNSNGTGRFDLHEEWGEEIPPARGVFDGEGTEEASSRAGMEPLGDSLSKTFEEGLRRLEAGRFKEAGTLFRLVLSVRPTHADSLHLLGVIAHRSGQLDQAVDYFLRAIEQQPAEAHYRNNFGNLLRDLGRPEEAVEQFLAALRLRPGSPEIHSNLGNALCDLGRREEAVDQFRAALELGPDLPGIQYNLGNALAELGRFPEAEGCYRKALDANSDDAEAHYGLGNTLTALRRHEEAERCYREALLAKPDFPEACNNLGNVYQELNLTNAAELCYRDALRLRPDYAEAYYNLGCALMPQNNLCEAVECLERALALDPGNGAARLALCVARLPVLYLNELEVARRRIDYTDCLERLCDEVRCGGEFDGLAEGVGASQPFFLAYQGYNDRELQARYGSLVCRIMAREAPPVLPAPLPARNEKIRVGIVSGFFYRHTVWKLLIEGWLKQLDRARFEVFGYHTGTRRDEETKTAEGLCDRFVQGSHSRRRWRDVVAGDAPHVLLYPELGMDPRAARLAAQRLAPVQCVSWGHPVTSGFPTVDYFLSSELMEPVDAAEHYTERLVRLPNLATWYEPDPPPPVRLDRSDLGMRSTAVVYWSGQSLYKYLPRYDLVFPRIAERVGDCQFVFIEYARSRRVTEQFRVRLKESFALLGMNADDYCLILPYLERDRFIAAVGLCDVVLDTLGWSGGKSTLDCLTHDLPVVTLPGPLMRSRHTAAILRRMDETDNIADSVDGYIRSAVRMGRDLHRRRSVARRISKNKHRLYRDREYISALEEFLDMVCRRPGNAGASRTA